MPVPVYFSKGRLQVGWRKRDCEDVWFELGELPNSKERKRTRDSNNDDGKRALVFSLANKDDIWPAPDPDEILWISFFDPANVEAKTSQCRAKMQRDYLVKAYQYMSEQNPDKVYQMEQDLDDPKFVRWQTWFDAAKKEKHKKMKRRRRRADSVRASGVPEEEIQNQVSSDASDDEGNVNSADEDEGVSIPRPLVRAATNGRKRKGEIWASNGNGRGNKRCRAERGSSATRDFQMSGARGSSCRSINDLDNMHGFYDSRPPHPATPSPSNRPTPSRGGRESQRRRMSEHRARKDDVDEEDNNNDLSQRIFVSQNTRTPSEGETQSWKNFENINGIGVDDDEAILRALRESMVPESPIVDSTKIVPTIEPENNERIGE